MDQFPPEDESNNLSTLQLVDLISHRMAMQGVVPPDIMLLRRRIEEMEELQDQARNAVEKLSEAVDKLRAPALRLGTLSQKLPPGAAAAPLPLPRLDSDAAPDEASKVSASALQSMTFFAIFTVLSWTVKRVSKLRGTLSQ